MTRDYGAEIADILRGLSGGKSPEAVTAELVTVVTTTLAIDRAQVSDDIGERIGAILDRHPGGDRSLVAEIASELGLVAGEYAKAATVERLSAKDGA